MARRGALLQGFPRSGWVGLGLADEAGIARTGMAGRGAAVSVRQVENRTGLARRGKADTARAGTYRLGML